MSLENNEGEFTGIERRELLKRIAVSFFIPKQFAFRAPVKEATKRAAGLLKPHGISGVLKIIEDGMIRDMQNDPGELEFLYETWIEDPSSGDNMQYLLERAGLIRPGEPVNHATWKRAIRNRVEQQGLKNISEQEIEEAVEELRFEDCLQIQNLMHQPFTLYDEELNEN